MIWRRLILALVALALAPASAGAHAYLVKEQPSASIVLGSSPPAVKLTYSEAVEPRFAIISVTDKDGNRVTSGLVSRSGGNPDELDVPLEKLKTGWYLVYWRVISVDGHPVRGAFTFAVGPTPGPPPEFAVPSLTESAATGDLLAARWIVLLSLMASVGLLAFRLLIARPLLRRVPETSLRAVSVALGVSLAVSVVSTLVYVNMATADFAAASFFDFGRTFDLLRDSSFGRGYTDLALILVLLALASALAVRIDRPEREHRSIAEIGATAGALAAAAAALLIPGLAGHAGQYTPRGGSLALDWAHMLAGSLWIGGLLGLSVVAWKANTRRVACMVVVVPRFSRVALFSVLLLIATGTVATVMRLPTLASLWETGYGQALIVKVAILLVALVLAAVNLLRTTPRLEASERRPGLGEPTTRVLRRLVGGEAFLIAGAIFAAGVMSSVAPPPEALGQVGAATAKVGPGPISHTVEQNGYKLEIGVAPNRAVAANAFSVRVTRDGKPVPHAEVNARITMLDMEMGQQNYDLKEGPGSVYALRNAAPLVMAGHWALDFTITPPGEKSFQILLLDKATG
ncbi:MAG: copper resistance CopC/CopD family protein [Solirubrobacteraceae bacterium]